MIRLLRNATIWWTIFLSMIIGVGFILYRTPSHHEIECNRVESIAGNLEKIDYLFRWVDTYATSASFSELIGRTYKMSLRRRPELIKKVGIDWEYLGWRVELAFVSLNRSPEDRKKVMDPVTIKSVTVGAGRFGIIISMPNTDQLGIERVWDSKSLKRLVRVSDRVHYYCL